MACFKYSLDIINPGSMVAQQVEILPKDPA